MALEDAGKGSFRDGKNHKDLGVGAALFAESEDLLFELGRSFAWLLAWDRREILQTSWEVGGVSAFEPLANGFVGDGESGGGATQRVTSGLVELHQFSSHEGSEFGISVHVVREG